MRLKKSKSKEAKQDELPGTPGRDEVGQAAEKLIDAEEQSKTIALYRDKCERALYSVMRKHGRQSVSVLGYRFSLRVRPTREIVAMSKI